MKKAIGGLIFDTDSATVLARSGDGNVLYQTPNGRYFECTHSTLLAPEITILTEDEAMFTYNRFLEKLVDFKLAFPDIEFREA